MSLKILWYCTKAQPFLYHDMDYCYDTMNTIDLGYKTLKCISYRIYDDETGAFLGWDTLDTEACKDESLNGKIVAESDYEVEKIFPINETEDDYDYGLLSGKDLLKGSCLSTEDIFNYLQDQNSGTDELFKKGYAISIKDLHIFDEPKELHKFMPICTKKKCNGCKYFGGQHQWDIVCNHPRLLSKAPQNMCYVVDEKGNRYVIIPVHSERLAMILNGTKTIEVKKKVLKEML